MFLFINTALNNKLTIALVSYTLGILDRTDSDIYQNHSEKLLPAVEKLLSQNKLILKDLKGIGVVRGPGSFTGVRVGVACTNALGFALNIPVKGIRYQEGKDLVKQIFQRFPGGGFDKPVVPFYQYKPV
ncbi:MAG: tRNA (adenosine(37)-N6)-threonylcarbamoyltransferase complex dimerization subunit type 1 TsaB [Patescibacteria group bacterium]|nr:tRNA (adenosine(37)-N6)-threonylcarbamoyltransferase complex dimerization subunit type 1 TsaB [Patescibacteria group bacterium]